MASARAESLRDRSLRGEILTVEEYAEIRASVEQRGLTRSPEANTYNTGNTTNGAPPLETLVTHHIPVYLQIEDGW